MSILLPKNADNCPRLILAPMEGVGDGAFRKSMAAMGGFDEAVREFLRVPRNGHIPSLIKVYDPLELDPYPIAAQIMGGEPDLMAEVAGGLEEMGAPRIDINCGCPSKKVNGRGAGSSLLKKPEELFDVCRAVSKAVNIPVTIKMRSGFEDTSLYRENLLAAQESGMAYITMHPRTKREGYTPPARWDLIAEAKEILDIPVVGNGDILNVADALRMLKETHCDALMIGRGAIINPFIFHEIKAHFAAEPYLREWEDLEAYFKVYLDNFSDKLTLRSRVSKLKQLFGFFFKGSEALLEERQNLLRTQYPVPEEFMAYALPLLKSLSFS